MKSYDGTVIMIPDLTGAFTEFDSPMDILKNAGVTVEWKLYKQTGKKARTLLFECYNKILTVNLKETGKYDVVIKVYDKNGNKYEKDMVSIITVM